VLKVRQSRSADRLRWPVFLLLTYLAGFAFWGMDSRSGQSRPVTMLGLRGI
jgi:hypothetical protein